METTPASSLDDHAIHFSHHADSLSLTGNTGARRVFFIYLFIHLFIHLLASRGQNPRTGVTNPHPDGRDPTGFSILPGSVPYLVGQIEAIPATGNNNSDNNRNYHHYEDICIKNQQRSSWQKASEHMGDEHYN